MKLLLLGGVMGVALGGMFGYHAVYQRNQAQARLVHRQITTEQAEQEAQKKAAVLLEALQQHKAKVSPDPDPSWLVQQATTLARQANLELSSISPEAPQLLQQFTRLAVSLAFEATYHEVGQFVDAVERCGHLIRVERLAIGIPKEPAGKSTVQLLLSTLYVPPDVWGE